MNTEHNGKRIFYAILPISIFAIFYAFSLGSTLVLWVICAFFLFALIDPLMQKLQGKGINPIFLAIALVVGSTAVLFGLGFLIFKTSSGLITQLIAYKSAIFKMYENASQYLSHFTQMFTPSHDPAAIGRAATGAQDSAHTAHQAANQLASAGQDASHAASQAASPASDAAQAANQAASPASDAIAQASLASDAALQAATPASDAALQAATPASDAAHAVNQAAASATPVADAGKHAASAIQSAKTAGAASAPAAGGSSSSSVSTSEVGMGVLNGLNSVFSVLTFLVLTPLLTFFMVAERDQFGMVASQVLQKPETGKAIWKQVTDAITAYFVGNVVLILVSFPVFVLAFALLHVKAFLSLGLLSAIMNLIPFLGFILAAILPTLDLLLNGGHIGAAVGLVGICFVTHFTVANVITPKLLGAKLDLNATFSTIALIGWGELWGPMGLLLAIPVTALIKIAFQHSSVPAFQAMAALMSEDPKSLQKQGMDLVSDRLRLKQKPLEKKT